MDCQEIKKLLVPFIESQLTENQKAVIEVHLQACGGCQKEKMLLEKTWSMLDGVKMPEVSHDFTAQVMARIHEQKQGKPSSSLNFTAINDQIHIWVVAAAVLAVCVLGVMFSIDENHPIQGRQTIIPAKETLPASLKVNAIKVPAAQPINEVKGSVKRTVSEVKAPVHTIISDEEIIRHLDAYENAGLYQNYPLLKNMDEVESLGVKGPGL